MNKIIIGQEAICPDGLGRVLGFEMDEKLNFIQVITVRAYSGQTVARWNRKVVELIDPRGGNLNVEEITKTVGDVSITEKKAKFKKAYVITLDHIPKNVVLDDLEQAEKQLKEMISVDYMQYSHYPTLDVYMTQNKWKIHSVDL